MPNERAGGVRWAFCSLLVALLILALPTLPHSAAWGYYPSGGVGILLLIVLILVLTRRRV